MDGDMEWLTDGRKIPDPVMFYIRAMAVYAVRELGHSPELVAQMFNFNRPGIYRWLKQYDSDGYAALKSDSPPGATPLVNTEIDQWMVSTILNHTPLDFGYDTPLWTCRMVAELLQQEFAVTVSDSTIRLHLQRLRLTPQKPSYQDSARDAAEIESFLNDKFIRIQRLAKKIGADIGFEDESGVMTPSHRGTTWGKAGETPVVKASSQRGRYNVLSVVMPDGTLRYSIREGTINETVFIKYLQQLLQPRQRPLILLLDRARFHGSKAVRAWVRQHRKQLRIYFLPRHAPELNPDEQVWNEIKNNQLRKQAIKNKVDLKKRLRAALAGLQRKTQRVTSFFHMPDTKYVLQEVSFVS